MTNSMELEALASMAVAWHRQRFPAACPQHVAMKAAAELGELLDAILPSDLGGKGDVGEEAADVFLTLLVLLGRFYPSVDLLADVQAALAFVATDMPEPEPTPVDDRLPALTFDNNIADLRRDIMEGM